jgi:serine protease Do
MEVSELSEAVAERLGYRGLSGVVISEVEPESLAGAAGLKPGMLIMRVGNTEVGSVLEFEAAMKRESLSKGILFLVRSRNGNRFVVLKAS